MNKVVKYRHPSDYTEDLAITEQYFPINANIGAAIRFHKQAIRAVELEKTKRGIAIAMPLKVIPGESPEAHFSMLCKIEHNALLAVAYSTPRNLNEAIERLVYLENYYRTLGQNEGENAWPVISMCIQSLEHHAA